MNNPGKKQKQAGGSIIAISIIAGTIGGVIVGQTSAGFLIGLAAGILIAFAIWAKDRA